MNSLGLLIGVQITQRLTSHRCCIPGALHIRKAEQPVVYALPSSLLLLLEPWGQGLVSFLSFRRFLGLMCYINSLGLLGVLLVFGDKVLCVALAILCRLDCP